MSQKTYMYDTQWTALINAIQGGDPTAIVTALGQIKTSIDSITTALGSLSADVTQDSTQWNDLLTAIGSGGGGGGGTIDIDATQWSNLLTSIDKGDTSALATALGLIKSSVDSINTSLGSLSVGVSQNATQWTNLVNAITNQSLTVDLSNVTSSVVSNLSNVSGSTTTDALNTLKSNQVDVNINNIYDGIGIVLETSVASFSSGIANVDMSAYLPTGCAYTSISFAIAADTSTIYISGCSINSSNICRIRTANTFTGSTAISILAFYRRL